MFGPHSPGVSSRMLCALPSMLLDGEGENGYKKWTESLDQKILESSNHCTDMGHCLPYHVTPLIAPKYQMNSYYHDLVNGQKLFVKHKIELANSTAFSMLNRDFKNTFFSILPNYSRAIKGKA